MLKKLDGNQLYECSRCDGEGTVFNRDSLLLTIAFPIAWMACADILRKRCPKCDGKGYIKIKE